jgi:hypothetical protein
MTSLTKVNKDPKAANSGTKTEKISKYPAVNYK